MELRLRLKVVCLERGSNSVPKSVGQRLTAEQGRIQKVTKIVSFKNLIKVRRT